MPSTDADNSSQSSSRLDPSDLSDLFFPSGDTRQNIENNISFIGPIRVDWMDHKDRQGRCVRATRDIAPGEALLVVPPLVAAPVAEVYREWCHDASQQIMSSVAQAAEQVLVRQCQTAVRAGNLGVIHALSALEDGSSSKPFVPSINLLLGRDQDENLLSSSGDEPATKNYFSDERLLQIIRRNAFGGDFVTDRVVEQRWTNETNNSSSSSNTYMPQRLLGHYPVAAMINHSCLPNAVRVFCGRAQEIMVVHACQRIAQGEEIVWSYIPLTDPVAVRRQRLQQQHGFVCRCERCRAEQAVDVPMNIIRNNTKDAALALEEWLTSAGSKNNSATTARLSNTVQRYLRVSHFSLYLDYLNADGASTENADALLKLCTQLHFSLAATHNASTEHLSVRSCLRRLVPCFILTRMDSLTYCSSSHVVYHRFYFSVTTWWHNSSRRSGSSWYFGRTSSNAPSSVATALWASALKRCGACCSTAGPSQDDPTA